MTPSDTQRGENEDGSTSSVSRRSCLAGLATAPLVSIMDMSAAVSKSIDPDDFLITQSHLPDAFTTASGTDMGGAFNSVRSPGDGSPSRDQVALNRFWAGDNSNEPFWVAGSSACLGVSSDDVTTATEIMSQEYAEFVEHYDAETDRYWHFDSQYSHGETFREWRTEIYINRYTPAEELFETSDRPELIDVFRMQHINNTLVGTVLFGPTEWEWSFSELLDRLTEYQREQARSLTATDTEPASGDE